MKMEEWKECKLGDICKSNINSYSEKDNWSFVNYLDTGNITENKISDIQFIDLSSESLPSRARRKVQINDIIYSTVRPNQKHFGIIKNQPENFLVSTGFAVLHINKTIADPNFVFYNLIQNENTETLHAIAEQTTSAYPAIKPSDIENLSIKLPPLPTQQKIAAILSSLDDKIELNNKINTNLEQQAQALFKNWFVDFEPFGGKMPEGWKEADIYSIANIIYGSPFASKLFNTEKNGKPIIRIRDLKDQHSDVYTPEKRDDAYLIQPKDIVVGMDGEFRPYIWGSEPGWLNQRVCVFENKRPKGKAFLYFSIKPLLDVVEKTQVATTVIHIGKKDFDKFQIILPTEDILDRFDELTDPILDQIVANRLENRRLAELRDALLPKLINGEIEV